jgi:WD40 repeat protein
VKLWDVATGKVLATLEHLLPVHSLAVTPDGTTLAAGIGDGKAPNTAGAVKLWDVAQRRERATLTGHRSAVWAVTFLPDGKTLASGSADGTAKLWEVNTLQELGTVPMKVPVRALAAAPDGRTLAVAGGADASPGAAGVVRLWDIPTGRERITLTGQHKVIFGVSFSPDGRTLATASKDGTVKLWAVSLGRSMLAQGK